MGRFLSPGGKWKLEATGGYKAVFQRIDIALQAKTNNVWGDVANSTKQATTNGNNWSSPTYVQLQANVQYRLKMVLYFQQDTGNGAENTSNTAYSDYTTIP